MITNILTYIDGRGSAENAAEAAFQLAVRHNAHVEGLHVRADARDFITNAPVMPSLSAANSSLGREVSSTPQLPAAAA